MVTFASILVATLFAVAPASQASPVPTTRLDLPLLDVRGILCSLPPLKHLCPRDGSSDSQITTPLGVAKGTSSVPGARRFAVRYATAERWKESSLVKTWALPNNATDPSALPLSCPQKDADEADFSEDCLSMILYVPDTVKVGNGVSTMVWIHGGSYIQGSATAPGLDGSKLAIATNSIVAVIQYRLGALGLLAPNGPTNLAVKDVINSLKFLKAVVPSFGGSGSKITLAGQSSGADMIRVLLATPTADSLFQSAILQSDPMDYGFLRSSTKNTLQDHFNSGIGCSSTDAACLAALPISTILSSQASTYSAAVSLDPASGQGQPIRPLLDGTLVTSPLDSTGTFPGVSKPVLVSSVLNDAGSMIYGNFGDKVDSSFFSMVIDGTFGDPRAEQVQESSYYALGDSSNPSQVLETMGTDYLWKCSGWTFSRDWVKHGGKAYVGLYTVGATYPGNEDVAFCTQAGKVCHQDDIQIVFGTVSNPTSAQASLTTEMQKRYKAFLSNGNPNVNGLATWTAATSTDVHAKLLGSAGEATVGACDVNFWGSAVQYDYQFYNS